MSDVDSPWPDQAAPPPPGFPVDGPDDAGGGAGDGVSVALSGLAIVGLLVAIFALWLARCDVNVLERLVESVPGTIVNSSLGSQT